MTENMSSSEITPLSGEQLNDLVTSFDASQSNRLAMNAVTAAGIDKVALNYDRSVCCSAASPSPSTTARSPIRTVPVAAGCSAR